MIVSANDLHLGDSKHALQLACWNRHRPWIWSSSRRRLRKGSSHRRVKAHTAFNLLHYLMNMPVQYCD